jgi:uncharacterized damage-inducible protein DinB
MKEHLHQYLRDAREALLWKMDNLSEYDVRRPLVPTGTNLLGLVKHVASTASGYFGVTFGRPFPEPIPWLGGEPDADMWAAPGESRADIVGMYRRVWQHADETIAALDLDATGTVPWWAPGNEVTLAAILTHMLAEVSRHAGHADIVRELIDGDAGWRSPGDNLAEVDREQHRARIEEAARRCAPLA